MREPEGFRDFVAAGLDQADAVRRLLANLPAQQRVVLILRYWVGLTEAEIAATLHCSPGTVKSRASRALAALREHGDLADVRLTTGGDR